MSAHRREHDLYLVSDVPVGRVDQDYFGFAAYANAVAGMIDNPRTTTPLTIAITAPFGGGKTSVARLIRWYTRERARQGVARTHVVECWFDAWLHHDAPHLGAALAASVARSTNRHRAMWKRFFSPLPLAMLRPIERWRRTLVLAVVAAAVGLVVTALRPIRSLAAPILDSHSAVLLSGSVGTVLIFAVLMSRSVFGVAAGVARFLDDPQSEAARGVMIEVRMQLTTLIRQAVGPGRLVVYVDNLERCSPERQLQLCEVSSQLLSQRQVVTVILADLTAVSMAVRARYGLDADAAFGRAFLEKVAQVEVALPKPQSEDVARMLRRETPHSRPPAAPIKPVLAPPESHAQRLPETSSVESLSRYEIGVMAITISSAAAVVGAQRAGVTAVLIGLSLIVGVAVIEFAGTLLRRVTYLRYRERTEVVRQAVDTAIGDGPPKSAEEIAVVEEQVEAQLGTEHASVISLVAQEFVLDSGSERRAVEDIIVRYAAPLPRTAKRILNNASIMASVATQSGLFNDPDVTPGQLGRWIVLTERWPDIGDAITGSPTECRALEIGAESDQIVATIKKLRYPAAEDVEVLTALLLDGPPLSPVIGRFAYVTPAAPYSPGP